jgi:perosamine synthetase
VYQFIENLKSDKTFFFYAGRVALYALLKAMGIREGEEIIAQVFTCFRVLTPMLRLGINPVYVDIDPCTFSIDPSKVEERITDKARAILVQHTFGIPARMNHILDIARRYNLWVIEDSCHALGSRYDGQEVGTFGDAAFYSFGWHKPVVLGTGGAAVVNNPRLKQKMAESYNDYVTPSRRELLGLCLLRIAYELLVSPVRFSTLRDIYRRQFMRDLIGRFAQSGKKAASQGGRKEVDQQTQIGKNANFYSKKIIPFQENRLFRRLDAFDDWVAHQDWAVSRYRALLPPVGYEFPELDDRFEPVYYKYPLLSDHKATIFEHASQARVELSELFISPLYPPWHKRLWEKRGYREGMCPISEHISDRVIPLSVHSKIHDRDIDRTMALLMAFQ